MYGFPEDFLLIGSLLFVPVLLNFILGKEEFSYRISTKMGLIQIVILSLFVFGITWQICITPYFH